MTLTVTSKGAKLKRCGCCIEVEKPDGLVRIPASELKSVLLTVPCSLTSEMIALCMERNIAITMLDWRGAPLWRIDQIHGGARPLICRNQLAYGDTEEGVEMAKRLLREKNRNRIDFLKRLASNRRNETGEEIKECCAEIEQMVAKLNAVKGKAVKDVRQTLLGFEGTAGRMYFRPKGGCKKSRACVHKGACPGYKRAFSSVS